MNVDNIMTELMMSLLTHREELAPFTIRSVFVSSPS